MEFKDFPQNSDFSRLCEPCYRDLRLCDTSKFKAEPICNEYTRV